MWPLGGDAVKLTETSEPAHDGAGSSGSSPCPVTRKGPQPTLHLLLIFVLPRCKSSLVDPTLPQRRQRLVRGFLFRQGLLQQAHGFPIVEEIGVGDQTAVGGDLVVLHPLGGRDQRCVDYRLAALLLH